ARAHGVEDWLHERRISRAGRRFERGKGARHSSPVPLPSKLSEPSPLLLRELRVVRCGNGRSGLARDVLVDSNNDQLAGLDRALLLVRALRNRLLEIAALYRLYGTS